MFAVYFNAIYVNESTFAGVLAVTRALGDLLMKDLVVSNPFTSETILVDSDEFVIIACDGVGCAIRCFS